MWKRLLFAWTQTDVNILFTSYLQPQSRIQIWRNVQERVQQIAPFLRLDQDPYAVVSEGKQYWIQDAYTVSDHFPYSSPHAADFEAGLNYIRNSVKVVVDMYDGDRPVLRHGSERPRPGGLPACVSGRLPGPEPAFARI